MPIPCLCAGPGTSCVTWFICIFVFVFILVVLLLVVFVFQDPARTSTSDLSRAVPRAMRYTLPHPLSSWT